LTYRQNADIIKTSAEKSADMTKKLKGPGRTGESPLNPLPKPAYAGKELNNGTKTKPCKEKGNGNNHYPPGKAAGSTFS
jgi:hypothetical protein